MAGDVPPRDFLKVRGEFVDCPHCGCPNRITDRACSYCERDLSSSPGVATRIKKAVDTIKWRYRLKSRRPATGKGVAWTILTVAVGLTLALLGGYLIYSAVATASAGKLLMGVIFALYGGYAVAHVLGLVGK